MQLSDSRRFTLVMIVAAAFVSWILIRGFNLVEINQTLKANEALNSYFYPFRVLRLDGTTAIMGTLQSPEMPVEQSLRLAHPYLRNLLSDDKLMQQAQRDYAQKQAIAMHLALQDERISDVQWELDQNWLHLIRRSSGLR